MAFIRISEGRAVFDETMNLRDVSGVARAVRVVCGTAAGRRSRAPVWGLSRHRGGSRARGGRPRSTCWLGYRCWFGWSIRKDGGACTGADPRRWGSENETRLRRSGTKHFDFKSQSGRVMSALQKALSGTPVFDVINARTSSSGGRLHLRITLCRTQHDRPVASGVVGARHIDRMLS